MSRLNAETTATLVGSTAVMMWAVLALLTTWTGGVPPLQLAAMAFTVAFALSLAKWILKGEPLLQHLRHPAPVWIVGIGGLFGFHFLYFLALRNAPAAEANLINYSWPILIVLFSAMLPGERLGWHHLVGALAGLLGCALLVTGGAMVTFQSQYALGYLAATSSAFTWAAYSVLSRRFAAVPTDTVGWFCGGSALLGLLTHLSFERTVWPDGAGQWLAVLGLGLGPVGLAFFVWDIGVKRGNIRVLGAAAYGAPLLSTLALVAFGRSPASQALALSCALIVGGAALAAKDMLFRKRTR